jgi:class 3 adenylate cyclase
VNAPGDIRYARTRDGIDIAYTVFGQGPDLLILPGFVSHLDHMWDFAMHQVLIPLGRRFRVIALDKRGTGLSDRSLGFGSIEDRTEDARAVLDAVGSEQAIVYGISEGGPMSVYLAASQPERVRALVLYGTYAWMEPTAAARVMGAVDAESLAERRAAFLEAIEKEWGQGRILQLFAARPPDPAAAERVLSRYERSACTPQMAREIMSRNVEINVRPFLPLVSAPTLVVHCSGDPIVPVELGRTLAQHIAGARYVEIVDDFHASWRHEDMEKVAEAINRFLDDLPGAPEPAAEAVGERELATVLFTDIVSSTERVAEAGDAAWKALLDRHEQAAARAIEAEGGRLVEHTGDGVLATFGGPSHAVSAARSLQDAGVAMGVAVRAGVHTGEVERRGDRIGGIGVHIAARIMALAGGGEILVSRTVRDLAIGSKVAFEDRGPHELKGVTETWQLFAVA